MASHDTDGTNLERFGPQAWQLVGILLALAMAGWLVIKLSVVVVAAILGLLIAATFQPLMRRLVDHGWPRTVAALTLTFGWILALLAIFALVGWRVVDQLPQLGQQIGDAIDRLRSQYPSLPIPANGQLDQLTQSLGGMGSEEAVSGLTTAGKVLSGAALAIVLSFFFLRDGRQMWDWALGLVRRPHRAQADDIGRAVYRTLSDYIRGLTVVAFADAVFSAIGLIVLGVPLATALAVLTFFAAYIPTVGALVVGGLAVGVAFASGGLTKAIIVLVLYTVIQQVDGDVLHPWIMGQRLPLHPAAVLVALAAGGLVAGMVGALLGVPVAAAVMAAVNTIRDDDPAPAGGT